MANWINHRLVEQRDTYLDRVAKYVPVEIVAAYLALNGLFPLASAAAPIFEDPSTVWMLRLLALCWVLTPLYVWRLSQGTPPKPWRLHAVMSSIAFPIWAFAIGGAAFADIHVPKAVPSALLIVFSLVAGLVEPTNPKPAQKKPLQ